VQLRTAALSPAPAETVERVKATNAKIRICSPMRFMKTKLSRFIHLTKMPAYEMAALMANY
jgi:hypothetical protein